jgi:hypothetical protein
MYSLHLSSLWQATDSEKGRERDEVNPACVAETKKLFSLQGSSEFVQRRVT